MFEDRRDAGRRLAARLLHLRGQQPIVLALPRGGVPVGREIAQILHCPLEVVLVRKLAAPWQPQLAAGAVVGGAVVETVLNEDVIKAHRIDPGYIARASARAQAEIERRRLFYLGEKPPVRLDGRTAIVVDDGVVTGASIRAALKSVHRGGPARIVVAAPVAPREAVTLLEQDADEVIIDTVAEDMGAIGFFYRDFHQLDDEEVIDLLDDMVA
ncbi:Predicted phosphoribosyltransferase [Arboricoccus pini]|uniref:Predicted phosphoribosyltransferase n=1 Tax=Arboricoccus pini TaxID=1963835 RepID=A0A212QMY4_9PROT|nr:phosphoribosyltransferase family protein [Arboricoccus pini]SNB60727.1 Predicted phosphoribosyltransferase [Arboricoccus pini]